MLAYDKKLSKPFGFVCYKNHECAEAAIANLHGTD